MHDAATMWLCGIEDVEYKAQRLDFWNDVYGYDMSCIREVPPPPPPPLQRHATHTHTHTHTRTRAHTHKIHTHIMSGKSGENMAKKTG